MNMTSEQIYLLQEALKYITHTRAVWVSDFPNDYMKRGKFGHWKGTTCVLVDPFDQSGSTRCTCGADTLKKNIRRALKEEV